MFKPGTVLIVGAGASAEVDLPIGTGLINDIASILHFPPDELTGRIPLNDFTRDLLNRGGREELREYQRAAVQMIGGMRSAESIDRYIDRFSEDQYIRTLGKAAIVKAIAVRERSSKLAGDKGEIIRGRSEVDDTWYWTFAKILCENVGRSRLESVFDGLSIVCFNYDRCIEHYLVCELMRSYHIDRKEAANLVSRLAIWHPYGTIAPLDTQEVNGIGFGCAAGMQGRYFELSARINTFTEQHEDRTTMNVIRTRIRSAHTIVFLGFGFYDQNLQLVEPDGPTKVKWILGTGYGLSDSARNVVRDKLVRWNKGDPHGLEITKMKCAPLLDHFRMQLSS